MKLLVFTPVVLFSALTFATQSEFKYYDPNTWNMSIPENILQYLDALDAIDPSIVFRNTSALDDQQCNNDFLSIFHDLRENQQWPKVMLDAGNSLQHGLLEGNRIAIGNYDECLSVNPPNRNFTAKYCLAYINDTIDSFDMEDLGFYWFRRPIYLIGVCIPSTCSAQYLNRIAQEIRIPFSNQTFSESFGIGVNGEDCHTANENLKFTTLNWITIGILLVFAACLLASSLYDIFKKGKPTKLCLAFSVPKNLADIFNTKQSKRISSMGGLKAISAIYMVFGHCYYLQLNGNIQNQHFADLSVHGASPGALLLNHANTAVDTFLFLSGILLVTSFLNEVKRRSQYDPGASFIKRFLRLMAPVYFILLVILGISEQFYNGPVGKAMNKFFRNGCKGYVWSNLLCYNNFLQTTTEMCIQHFWYIYVDLQLTLASQLILIYALWYPKRAMKVAGIVCWGAVMLKFTMAYVHKYGAIEAMDQSGYIFKLDYSMPHTKSTPWFAGMFLGFWLQDYNSKPLKMSKVRITIAWLLCVACLFGTIYPLSFFDRFEDQQPWAAIYFCFRRFTWSIGLGFLVVLCLNGYGGYLEKLFSWAPLNFYDNIAFELFCVHIPCLEFMLATSKDTMYFSYLRVFYMFFSILAISTILAIGLKLMVTAPCNIIIMECLPGLKIIPLKSHWNDRKDAKAEPVV